MALKHLPNWINHRSWARDGSERWSKLGIEDFDRKLLEYFLWEKNQRECTYLKLSWLDLEQISRKGVNMDALVVIWDAKSVDPKKLENELDDWSFGHGHSGGREKCL